MVVHALVRLLLGTFLGGKGAYHHHASDMFLQEYPQFSVFFLNVSVQLLHFLPEKVSYQQHNSTAGQEYTGEAPVQGDHHDHGAYHLNHHANQSGDDLHIVVSDYYRIIGQPVQPLAGVDGTYACEVLAEDIAHQT